MKPAAIFFLILSSWYGCFAQNSKRFYQYRKFWRDINKGIWLGAGSEYQQVKNMKHALFVVPDFYVRFGTTPRLYMSIAISGIFNFDGPIEYKNVSDVDFRTASYRYRCLRIETGLGYYVKHFFVNKGVYGVAVGGNYSIVSVDALDLDRLAPLVTNGQSIVIRCYNGNVGEVKPYIVLERYFWLKNKQLAIQLAYSYPAYTSQPEENYYSYTDDYYFYRASGHTFSLRLSFNLVPEIRYNPTKMSEL